MRRVRRSGSRAQAGYTMVILMMAVTILSVMTAMTLPNWTALSQRDKEEELIFRGLQYAEAIRVFQMRYGRFPVKLEELYKVKPRCIRQLYPDPMTEDGEWALIYANGPGTAVNRRGGRRGGQRGQRQDQQRGQPVAIQPSRGGEGTPSGLPQSRSPGRGRRQAAGPIMGVYSKAKIEQTFKVFMDQDQVDQWAFTAELVSGVANAPDRPPQVPSANTLGRPFPDGVQPMVNFNSPQPPGNNQRRGTRPRRPGQNRQGFGVPQPSNPPRQNRNQGRRQ